MSSSVIRRSDKRYCNTFNKLDECCRRENWPGRAVMLVEGCFVLNLPIKGGYERSVLIDPQEPLPSELSQSLGLPADIGSRLNRALR